MSIPISIPTKPGGKPVWTTPIWACGITPTDIANRLNTVNGGVPYGWDNNGNLLNDGMNAYQYDQANRLAAINTTQYGFTYNGFGDRVSQTANSVTTDYTLDLASGLTQVLADGTNTYLYSNMRIGQQSATSTEYFLTDALGSVRQMVDETRELTLTQAYQPYGETLNSTGNAITNYAFAGEWRDASGLDYLRARYYVPWQGRFLTHDAWDGDPNMPMSYDAWLYGYANPVNFTDPSGHDPWWCEDAPDPMQCRDDYFSSFYQNNPNLILNALQTEFSIQLPPDHQFRFAYATSVSSLIPLTPGFIEPGGLNPWFHKDLYHVMGKDAWWVSEWDVCLPAVIAATGESVPSNVIHIDSSVYITDLAFAFAEKPDDIAGVMIHEATHAWQEYVAIAQQGEQVKTLAWWKKYSNGMERQAIQVTDDADKTGRIQLSDNAYKRQIVNYRDQVSGGQDSPFTLTPGVL